MKNKEITLVSNPLSQFGKTIDCKIKYHKIDKKACTEKYILKSLESVKLKRFKKYVWDNFEKRCYCSHDCCGHWFTTHICVKRISKNKFEVITHYAQNY